MQSRRTLIATASGFATLAIAGCAPVNVDALAPQTGGLPSSGADAANLVLGATEIEAADQPSAGSDAPNAAQANQSPSGPASNGGTSSSGNSGSSGMGNVSNTGGNAEPNSPANPADANLRMSGAYSGSVAFTEAQTIYPGDPDEKVANETYSQTVSLHFQSGAELLSGLPVFGYIDTPDTSVALTTAGQSITLDTDDGEGTPVTLTVTLTTITYTDTTIHAELALDHHGYRAENGYTETATGVETIDFALQDSSAQFSVDVTWNGVLHVADITIPNLIVAHGAGQLRP